MSTPHSSYKTVIRFEQAAEQTDGAIKRVIGFVPAKNILSLFDDATLDANPRSAKANSVVADIIGSLHDSPKIFQFKTKGILLATSDFSELERRRYELRFNEPVYEGLLDGGHNLLAIGKFFLSHVMDEDKLKKLTLWEDIKDAWCTHREAIQSRREEFIFKIPIELLLPSNVDDDDVVNEFRLALIDICAARNNNAQLTTEAKANQRGFYEEIRKRLPKNISDRVEWKSNEWASDDSRPIKVRDVVALAWIPLTVLREAELLPSRSPHGSSLNFTVPPQKIFANKGEVSLLFDKLMEHPDVSKRKKGPQYELHNVGVGSAFDVAARLPTLYDKIFVEMGEAYNEVGGKFGKIKAVRVPKRGPAYSPFTHQESKYGVPDGFVLPVLYGLKGLMQVENGKIKWDTDPAEFLDRHMKDLIGAFKMAMDMASFEPAKVAKNEKPYIFMESEVKKFRIIERA